MHKRPLGGTSKQGQRAIWFIVRLFVLAALITTAVTAYHWYTGAPLDFALRMMTDDFRLVATCPTEIEAILGFALRSPAQKDYLPMSSRYGDDWVVQVCAGEVFYSDSTDSFQHLRPATPVPAPSSTGNPFSLRDFVNGSWLEQQHPPLASSIKALGWVQDGLDGTASRAIQDLLYIAGGSRAVASSVVSLNWVQDGLNDVEAEAIHWMNNFTDVAVVSSIISLNWVQDGIDGVEVRPIEELSYIANKDAGVASSIISLNWVQDGLNDVEAEAIHWMNNFTDVAVVSSIISLDWVQDGIDGVEVRPIEELSYIANKDAGVASSIISLNWVQDGLNDVEAEAIHWMNNFTDVAVVSSIISLDWVQDDIDGVEVRPIEELSYIANKDAGVASSIISLNWVQDGLNDVEAEAIHWMNNFTDVAVVSSIISLDWVQDDIDGVEVRPIEELSYIANKDAGVASSIISLNWVQDGLNDVEAEAIHWMNNFTDVAVVSSIISLDWVQDDIDGVEVRPIEELSYIANKDAGVASSIISLNWVQDGLNDVEAEAIHWMNNFTDVAVVSSIISLDWVQDDIDGVEVRPIEELSYIANKDAGAAMRIVGMPFVETIEPPDISAIESLSRLAASEPETFVSVMSHPALQDGISNELAPIIATLHGVATKNPSLIDVLLDPGRALLEQRTITLPLSGDVVLYIIRTSQGAAPSMELLEYSVRNAEQYMGAPLPTNYIGLLFEDAIRVGYAGHNDATHITVLPKYDIDDGSREAEDAGFVIAHEVAHYYWSGNADWVDEGAANFLASTIEVARTGRSIGVDSLPCAYAGNIVEQEELGTSQDDVEFRCNYSLGERLFADLFRTLGDESFRQGFRALHLASREEEDDDNNEDSAVGIAHFSAAFRSDDEIVSAVVARWYDGTEAHDLSKLETGKVDPSLPSINGRIEGAYITTSADGPAVSAFSAEDFTDLVFFTIKYSYNVSGGPYEVPLEIVEYFEDGFDFRRHSVNLIADARYIGYTWRINVGFLPSSKWAPGRYVVHAYASGRKVAEVEYEVTP